MGIEFSRGKIVTVFVRLVCLFLAIRTAVLACGYARQSSQEPKQDAPQSQAKTRPEAPVADGGARDGQTKAKKSKKVWTDDEISKLPSKVSVVGESNPGSGTEPATASSNASSYRRRLDPLRRKLEGIERQIRDLQNAKLGGRENIARKMEQLEAQKNDVQAQIDAIEEEARKHGVAAGELR